MTEDEAKAKLCPRTLAATVIAGEANFYPAPCVGSACMAWRSTDNECGPTDPEDGRPGESKAAGFCGLAGKP